ncbi:MAG: lptD [Gammaproteobacteria bacterium]|jgi:LPS-assembly protein|nr:lptD [Gammaproteobacteria bacterium]
MRYYLISIFLLVIQTTGLAATDPAAICAIDTEASSHSLNTSNLSTLKKTMNFPKILGWVVADNLCGGYFSEPSIVTDYPYPKPIDEEISTITTTGQSIFRHKGPTELQGDVTFTQPGRQATADRVVLHQNQDTAKMSCMDLYGDVNFREAGKLLVGSYTHIDVEHDTWHVSEGVYQVERPSDFGTQQGWGVVDRAVKESTGIIQLNDATYTTCAPTQTPWYLKAKRITLDQETGRGVARNSWLYAGNMPVFYTPYANFPIDKRRQTGFLYPSFAYNPDSGFIVDIPYYLNLAPNYDATINLTPMTSRGLQLGGLFRYLTETSEGFLQTNVLPDDRVFRNFKESAPIDYPSNPYNDPFLDRLADDSTTRSSFAFHNNTIWNPNWSGSLDLNWVSDDYYFQDLGTGPASLNTDQLLNQAMINYQNEHWQFLARFQGFQTLHAINNNFVADQYKRLPQLSLDGSFPDQAYGLDYEISTEWVNFQHADDFFTDQPYPTGIRFHASPQVSRPYTGISGFLIPTMSLDVTSYAVSNNAIVNTLFIPPIIIPNPDPNLNTTRVLPIFSLDSGLYFDRTFNFMGKAYKQTLEPRVFYLYVPPTDQNNIPIFDTTLPAFDYNQLFRTNRFIGYDRIGDANQVSVGVTTRFLDGYTNEDKIDLSLGGIYYFRPHTQCLYPDCSDDPTAGQSISPITGQVDIHPNDKWSVRGTAAWDVNQTRWDNAGTTLFYRPLPQHVFKFAYNYVQGGDVTSGMPEGSSSNNLQRIDIGAAWQVRKNWSLIADWNYNLSHRHAQSYLYGVEYNSCCVAVRLVANHAFLSEINNQRNYRNSIYVQFLLKGLGTVGTEAAGDLILNAFPGYMDIFR